MLNIISPYFYCDLHLVLIPSVAGYCTSWTLGIILKKRDHSDKRSQSVCDSPMTGFSPICPNNQTLPHHCSVIVLDEEVEGLMNHP